MKTSKKSTKKAMRKRERIVSAPPAVPEPGFLFFFPKREFPPLPVERVHQGLLFEEAVDA
jgi:hypothetical protein